MCFPTGHSPVRSVLVDLSALRVWAGNTAGLKWPQATAGVCIATLQLIEQSAFKSPFLPGTGCRAVMDFPNRMGGGQGWSINPHQHQIQSREWGMKGSVLTVNYGVLEFVGWLLFPQRTTRFHLTAHVERRPQFRDLAPMSLPHHAIATHLEEVLISPTFRSAPRLSQMLRYLVEETLAGRAESITGTSISIDVFGRNAHSASEGDALVRVQARQLRLKLDAYYTAAAPAPLRIRIPTGGYRPLFTEEITPIGAHNATKITLITEPIHRLQPDPDIDLQALGLMADLETALYRFRDFSLQPSPQGASPSHHIPVDAEFALRLSGKAERQAGTIRFSFQVRGGRRNSILWSRHYDLALTVTDQRLARQRIADLVAVAIGCGSGAITKSLVADWPDQPVEDEPPILTLLRCHKYASRPNTTDYLPLRDALERVTDRHPTMASAWAMLASLYLDGVRFHFDTSTPPAELTDRALNCAQMAIQQDHSDAQGWYALGYIQIVSKDYERGQICAQRGLSLNPLYTDALAEFGHQHWIFGERERGLEMVNRAITLNEDAPGWYKFCLVEDALMQGNFLQARDILAEINMAEFFWVQFLDAVTSGHLGHTDGAMRALEQLESHAPWLLPAFERSREQWPFPAAFIAVLVEGLARAAALRDGQAGP